MLHGCEGAPGIVLRGQCLSSTAQRERSNTNEEGWEESAVSALRLSVLREGRAVELRGCGHGVDVPGVLGWGVRGRARRVEGVVV